MIRERTCMGVGQGWGEMTGVGRGEWRGGGGCGRGIGGRGWNRKWVS